MATLRPIANGLAIGLGIAYPLAVYFGLQVMQPRTLGALLLAVLLLRHGLALRRFAAAAGRLEWLLFAALAALAASVVAFDSADLLLLYPAGVSACLLLIFGRTLLHPPSMIERIARLSEPDLPPAGVRYTRRVTQVWCGFFLANGSVALATVFTSREAWALYNGLIAYLLMGLLFAGEWLVRRRVRRLDPA